MEPNVFVRNKLMVKNPVSKPMSAMKLPKLKIENFTGDASQFLVQQIQ